MSEHVEDLSIHRNQTEIIIETEGNSESSPTIVRGIDLHCPLSSREICVFEDYDALLNHTNTNSNSNTGRTKFYHLQVSTLISF